MVFPWPPLPPCLKINGSPPQQQPSWGPAQFSILIDQNVLPSPPQTSKPVFFFLRKLFFRDPLRNEGKPFFLLMPPRTPTRLNSHFLGGKNKNRKQNPFGRLLPWERPSLGPPSLLKPLGPHVNWSEHPNSPWFRWPPPPFWYNAGSLLKNPFEPSAFFVLFCARPTFFPPSGPQRPPPPIFARK